MSRKILFRGKRTDNGEWVSGNYVYNYKHDSHMIFYNCAGCINAGFKSRRADFELQDCEVDPKTVCQYTGLIDKNGRKIFENDIVSYMDTYSTDNGYVESDCIGKVLWCEEELCFHVTERLSAESWEVLEDCCVIGNIFDNPELLEVGE